MLVVKKMKRWLDKVIGVVVKRIILKMMDHERTMERYRKDTEVLENESSKVVHRWLNPKVQP
jgi:hypothetical protein